MSHGLRRLHSGRIPLPEVSGLSSTYDGTSTRLVAVGDDRAPPAVCEVLESSPRSSTPQVLSLIHI